MVFDAYFCVDWSARSQRSPQKPCKDALWIGEGSREGGGFATCESYHRTREDCVRHLRSRIVNHVARGRRVLVTWDFPFGYPAGFAVSVAGDGSTSWASVWKMLAGLIADAPDNANNRFEVASELNARCGTETYGPFWGCPANRDFPYLIGKRPGFPYAVPSGLLSRLRCTERGLPGVQETWKLYGNGSVGSQALLGIPRVWHLRHDPALARHSRIWPFETGFTARPTPDTGPVVIHAETWPGLFPLPNMAEGTSAVLRDQLQVRTVVRWAWEQDLRGELGAYFDRPERLADAEGMACEREEAWILGRR